MCLKLWISFSFPAVSAKTSMHTEEASARVTSQRTSFVSVGGQQLSGSLASPVSGAGRRDRSNV